VFITEDKNHDSDVVKRATDVLEDHLKTKTSINRHVIFSDGCAAQFKSKIPFSRLVDDHTERHYFGSSHGKSACDSLGGIVKKAATTAVASDRYSISCASDLYNFCQAELVKEVNCVENCHKGRYFFLLEDIEHRDKPTNLIAIKNTRSLHAIRHCNEQGADLEYKLLSCFCTKCLSKEECLNEKYTGEWQRCTLYKKETRPKKGAAKRKLDTPETPKFKRAKSKVNFVSFYIFFVEHKVLFTF